MRRISDELKQQAIRLRLEERLGIDDIRTRTRLSVGTLSVLLRDFPLTSEEVKAKMSQSSLRNNPLRKYNPEHSKFAAMVEGEELSTARKGRIAEAAVAFRLAVLGYDVLRDMFEGNRVDFVVARPGGNKYVRLQVRWAKREINGRPLFTVYKSDLRTVRHLRQDDYDFLVGYDMQTDTAFVVPVSVCMGKWRKTCDEEYAEAWHLLGI